MNPDNIKITGLPEAFRKVGQVVNLKGPNGTEKIIVIKVEKQTVICRRAVK